MLKSKSQKPNDAEGLLESLNLSNNGISSSLANTSHSFGVVVSQQHHLLLQSVVDLLYC